jgi:predicted DNA-binding transcriptional regulator AlpA
VSVPQNVPANAPQMRVNACRLCGRPLARRRPWQAFCDAVCRYAFHNRQRKQSPPSAATGAGRDRDKEEVKAYRNTKLLKYVYLKRRGERLAFTRDEINVARQRAKKLEAEAQAALKQAPFVTFDETCRALGYRSRESVYHLVRQGFLPPPVVLSVTPRRVGWRSRDVAKWLRQRHA